MLYYNIVTLTGFFVVFAIGLIAYIRNEKNSVNKSWFLLCVFASFWSLFYFLTVNAATKTHSLLLRKGLDTCGIFVALFWLRFVIIFLDLKKQRAVVWTYRLAACASIALFAFNFHPRFIRDMMPKYVFRYYVEPDIGYYLFVLYFFLLVAFGLMLLYRSFTHASPLRTNQIKYILFGSLMGFTGGGSVFPLAINIPLPPYLLVLFTLFPLIIVYAGVKHRLMDIRVAITRTGIFVFVYTIVLGGPFALAGSMREPLTAIFQDNWWIFPLGAMAVLATAGPFIFLYIQHRAEAILLREQKRYQDTLKQASIGMTRIKDLRKLLELIVHVLTRTVKLDYASIYLFDERAQAYKLSAIRDKGRTELMDISLQSALVYRLQKDREPMLLEEIKRRLQDVKGAELLEIEKIMTQITATLIVPSFVKNRLLGFLVLGNKLSSQIYTEDDLNILMVLANQAALAIENALFYQEVKDTQEQLFQAEKMATIGTMADGLSHQVNNRFNAMSIISEDSLDTIGTTQLTEWSAHQQELMEGFRHAFQRIKDNALQGGDIVRGMLKYSRAGDKGMEPLSLDQVIDAALEMAQYKVKLKELTILRLYQKDKTPRIKGNITQLQEVFFNLVDNAYDAIQERKETFPEEALQGTIQISALKMEDGFLRVDFEDNGIGIKTENKQKTFTPFFTTKVSSRKGTGLGLYVIKKIVTQNHNGKIQVASEYKQGTKFTVELPLADKE